jgi:hypothetical protein
MSVFRPRSFTLRRLPRAKNRRQRSGMGGSVWAAPLVGDTPDRPRRTAAPPHVLQAQMAASTIVACQGPRYHPSGTSAPRLRGNGPAARGPRYCGSCWQSASPRR